MFDKIKDLAFVLACLCFYICFCMLLSCLIPDHRMLVMFIGDVVCSLVFLLLYRYLFGRIRSTVHYKFTASGISLFVCLFFVMHVFSQIASTWVKQNYPSEGLKIYTGLSGAESVWYLILAVTFGPLVEELLFRGIIYKALKCRWNKWVAFWMSALAFAICHGTTEHIPLAVGLSFLCCFIFDVTDSIWYTILVHIGFNLCSMVFVVTMPISVSVGSVIYLFVLIVASIVYSESDFLGKKFRYHDGMPTLEERLNDKKNKWRCDSHRG